MSSFEAPRKARHSMPANSRQASMHSAAPCVVRELSAEWCTMASRSGNQHIGTGASRMRLPLPADCGSVDPAKGSPLCW